MKKQSDTEGAVLRQAERLYAEQRYADVVKHLAPQIFLFRGSARYYYLLGVASLHIGDLAGAHSYLLRGKDLDPLNIDQQVALAVTHLGRKEEPQALQVLVGIQDQHPTNKRVVQFLDLLKQASDRVDWPDQIRLGKLRHLYPRPGFNWRPWLRRGAIATAVLAAAGVAVALVMVVAPPIMSRQAPARAAGQEVSPAKGGLLAADDSRFGAIPGAKARFQLSAQEIDGLVNEATVAFREYRDNKARLAVNRIMQSNAPLSAKERMRGLANHFKDPGFVNFKDNPSVEAVTADPLLHSGVFVMWRGKMADVLKGQTAITFRLLVGYESSPVVKASVPVSLDFAAEVSNGEAIELIGQVLPSGDGEAYSLRGVALRLIRSGT